LIFLAIFLGFLIHPKFSWLSHRLSLSESDSSSRNYPSEKYCQAQALLRENQVSSAFPEDTNSKAKQSKAKQSKPNQTKSKINVTKKRSQPFPDGKPKERTKKPNVQIPNHPKNQDFSNSQENPPCSTLLSSSPVETRSPEETDSAHILVSISGPRMKQDEK